MTARHVMDLGRNETVSTLRKLEAAARHADIQQETETRSWQFYSRNKYDRTG